MYWEHVSQRGSSARCEGGGGFAKICEDVTPIDKCRKSRKVLGKMSNFPLLPWLHKLETWSSFAFLEFLIVAIILMAIMIRNIYLVLTLFNYPYA